MASKPAKGDDLPSFERPPVVETVLGVQFRPLQKLSNAHLGAFWKHLGAEWPTIVDAPPLEPTSEIFGDAEVWFPPRVGLHLMSVPAVRLQIRNAADDAMIQVQNGRFHYNWLGRGRIEYTRYRMIRPQFDAKLLAFRRFLSDEGVGELLPEQWEITYVNQLPKGTVWNSPADWAGLFPGLPGIWRHPSAVRLESLGGEWHFEIEPQRGRLHIAIAHARAPAPDRSELLRLILTARGPASDDRSLSEGLELGRKGIVMTFKEATSVQAHAYWGLQNEHA
jgi:uncharacterized protein (TIGR04255 family)